MTKLKLQTQVDKFTVGDGDTVEYTSQARARRALKTLAAFWAGALFSILIPVFHFVLVPGLFLVGPLMAWSQYKKGLLIQKICGSCPECQGLVQIEKASGNWPLRQNCPLCSAQIYINKQL